MQFKHIALAAAAIVIISGSAKAQSLTGKWTAEYPAAIRNTNGQQSAEMGTALVTIEQKGDSITGTWHAQNTPRPSQPRRIVGTFKDGQLSFVGEPVEARIRRGGEEGEQVVMMRSFFEAKLEGDSLVGTMHSKSEDGTISSQSLKWSAKRAAEN